MSYALTTCERDYYVVTMFWSPEIEWRALDMKPISIKR